MGAVTPVDRRTFLLGLGALASAASGHATPAQGQGGAAPAKRRNIIFVLTDDQRYDALGFMKAQPFLETPNMDRLAREGAHCKNAFVTTSLCSPSRASMLTGKYAFQHKIVDNNTPIPPGTTFFPQYLQKAGYKTAFIGKWHMGNGGDEPQAGFDHWISFRGQGTYLPSKNGLNIDGKHVPQKGYITDELTGYALDWVSQQPKDQPYFLYLSHKAVHADFVPAERHKGRYANAQFVPPVNEAPPADPAQPRPMWTQNQRNSWHGVEYPYHGQLSIADYYKRYAETLLAVDESLGRLMDLLEKRGELDSTCIFFAGDNGFCFGEHGLIDKRQAYEESIRIPLLARCPELIPKATVVKEVVANIDFMPTFLEAAGVTPPEGLAGQSFLPLLERKTIPWRTSLLYTYYWERNFPQTPTIHAIRTDRFKYIHYYGIWDSDELYDLQADPHEQHNLIYSQAHRKVIDDLKKQMFAELESRGGMYIPLYPDSGEQMNHRDPKRSHAADFPQQIYSKPTGPVQQ
ncbi:MAG TPA: sulfatase [Bryobacteraceae bacterium]|nr:sulfatase [Bryobacteraceae bacterium]